jgi:hypothetical protein
MRKAQRKEKKNLSAQGLIKRLRKAFDNVQLPSKDPRGKKKRNFS